MCQSDVASIQPTSSMHADHDSKDASLPHLSSAATALPQIPGMKKKRGRPSKADIAARQAFKAAQEAEAQVAETAAASAEAAKAAVAKAAAKATNKQSTQPAAKPAAVAVPTADLDPPAQHSASTSPAAAAAHIAAKPIAAKIAAAKPAAAKPVSKLPIVPSAAADSTGKASLSKGRSLSPQGRCPAGKHKAVTAAAAAASPSSPAGKKQGAQRLAKHAKPGDDTDEDDDYTPDDTPAAAPKLSPAKGMKRLKKQPPAARPEKKQATQQALEDADADAAPVPTPAVHAKHSQSSSHSQEEPFSPGEPEHVEILVDAVGLLPDQDHASCARARPWTKHLEAAALEAQAAAALQAQAAAEAEAEAAEQLSAEQESDLAAKTASTAQHKSATAAPPMAAAAAARQSPTGPANQDSLGEMGSGGSGQAAAAEQSGQRESHNKKRPIKDKLVRDEAKQAQQQDQHSQVHMQRGTAPRGSRTSPYSPPLPPADARLDDSRTGTSQPRAGRSHPKSNADAPAAAPGSNRCTQHRQTEEALHEAQASPSNEARSGDSSDNATVQHGVGHTGESSEAAPAYTKARKPAPQHQHPQHLPTSSLSEQAIHSAAGNTKSHPPGAVPACSDALCGLRSPASPLPRPSASLSRHLVVACCILSCCHSCNAQEHDFLLTTSKTGTACTCNLSIKP